MRIIDITVGIKNGMLVWPGDAAVRIEWATRINAGDQSNASSILMGAHVGTHVDLPLHFIEDGKDTQSLQLERLIGEVTVIEVPEHLRSIDAEFLDSLELAGTHRLLFKTKNGHLWKQSAPEFDEDFVAVNSSGARWLVEHGCQLVGIDGMSIAPYDETEAPHKILLENEIIVIETLNLNDVEPGIYQLICLPLKLESREAAPVRAILLA